MGRESRSAASVTLLLVLALTFLDTTVVAVVLGDIQYDLGAGVIPLQWVLDGYALPFAALMLVAGPIGDRVGRQRLMLAGLTVLGAGALLCALAGNVGLVIIGRAVMGAGAAAAEPGTLSVLRQLFVEPADRARALAAWGGVSGLSLALGPMTGGALVAIGSWRAVFWANAAAAAVLLLAVARYVPNSRDPVPGRVDVLGAVLGAGGVGAIVTAVITGEQYGPRALVLVGALIGGLALVGFLVVERRAEAPLLDLRMLAQPGIWRALFVAFAVWFGVFSIFFLTALYLDLAEAWSGARLAAAFAPMAVAIGGGSWVAARVMTRAGPRLPLAGGCAIAALAVVATRYVISVHPSFPVVTAVVAAAGLGFGVAVVPLTSVVLGQVPARRSGMAASATTTARQLGAVLGVAALGAIVNGYLSSQLGGDLAARGFASTVRHAILRLLETGGADAAGIDFAHPDPIVADLINAAVRAFRNGVHAGLFAAATLIALAGVVAVTAPRGAYRLRTQAPEDGQPAVTSGPPDGSAPSSTASTASA